MKTFEELQAGLGAALAANRAGSGVPHTVVAVGSLSVNEALLVHYGDRLMALEHRFLLAGLMTHRLPDASMLYVSSVPPEDVVIGYYRDLGPSPSGFAARTSIVGVGDRSLRPLSAKLLDRPDLLARLREQLAGRPAMLEPWNVTAGEVAVAEALQVPINGMDPALRHLGFKSAGRKLFRDAGVPVPVGVEDVRTIEDVLAAIRWVREQRPGVRAVVIKHDDSGAGDGNAVVELTTPGGADLEPSALHNRLAQLPAWYLRDLALGGVVEERLEGPVFTTPSVQIDLLPGHSVDLLATHEQVVGGPNGQVFLGCRFPADPAYADVLASDAAAIGARLVAAGALGRASVDFAAVQDERGAWSVFALEVNLRKGGTTHPYAALRNLVPGRYDARAGTWVRAVDGAPRSYECSDNLVDASFLGLDPAAVVRAVAMAGLGFDHVAGTGVVLHMLSGLGIDGRFGLTAIGLDAAQAGSIFEEARQTVADLARGRVSTGGRLRAASGPRHDP